MKSLLSADRISDFEIGRDKVVRDGDKCFVIDLKEIRARIEVQHDFVSPEYEANIAKLTCEQRLKMVQITQSTPYLSDEGRAERLILLEETREVTQ